MLLFRLLLLFAMAFIAWRIYRLLTASLRRHDDPARQLRSEDMVECSRCALRVPRSQAIAIDHRWYYCEQHRREDEGGASDR